MNATTPKERFDICQKCEHFFSATSSCKKCGCFMKIKVLFRKSECPVKKWSKIEKEKEPANVNT